MDYSTPVFPVLYHLPGLAQTHVHWVLVPSNHLILRCPLLLPSQLPSIRVLLLMSWLFSSGGLSIRDSVSASVLPMTIQDWFPLELTSWISLHSKGLSRVFSNAKVQKHQFFTVFSLLYCSTLTSILDYWKNYSFDYIQTFVGKVMSLLFRLVMAFLPRSKCLLMSWLQSPSAVILEPKKIKSVTVSIVSLFALKWWDQMPWS